MNRFARNRDRYAGALMALIGAVAAAQGWGYGVGGLSNMGAGFFPFALGVGMMGLGAVLALAASPQAVPHGAALNDHAAVPLDWRGASAIIAGVLLFILLADRAGLLAAIFACVFTAALGTRQTTVKHAFLLAVGVAVFGVLVFAIGLKVQFPIIRGVSF